MSRRDDTVAMRHMLDYAREAVALVRQRSRADLDDGQARYPDIPWRDAIAARNRIVHGYDTIDYDRLWQIITEEFPVLIVALERALPGHVG